MTDLLQVPPTRIAPLELITRVLVEHDNIVLTTHVNADGDAVGSECAVATWLEQLGKTVHIVNPTPYPAQYRYLVRNPEWVADIGTAAAATALQSAQVVLVLDTGEPKRIGKVASALSGRKVLLIDHHPRSDPGFTTDAALIDTSACATGELVYDLVSSAHLPSPWPDHLVQAVYAAIVTDTGSFRFSNTTPRSHALAGDLIRRGVDPEQEYKRLFGTVPLRRVQLLRAALDTLEVDPDLPITWISLPRSAMEAAGAGSEDLDGVVEHARSVEGTEVAILFRETADGSTKISLRSNGDFDVNAIARRFGGGGHIKASGAVIGAPMASAREKVLAAVRQAMRA